MAAPGTTCTASSVDRPAGTEPLDSFTLRASGPFSLAASSRFVEAFPAGQGGGGPRLDLAFPIERAWEPIGVRVTESVDLVHAQIVHGARAASTTAIRRAVERVLSLDVDGSGFPDVGRRDPVVRRLQQRYPGLRPVQFHSPYEAAAWAILGQRIRMTQAATLRRRLAEELGDSVDFGDVSLPSFPRPERLAALPATRGIPHGKVEQLRGLGRAAADGELDAERVRKLPRREALETLQRVADVRQGGEVCTRA